MDVFKLSRNWFDWCFENPEKIKPNHSALYFFCIEHCNRLGWKEKFGLPTTMAKEAIGISSYNTYKNTLTDLCDWGFIKMVEKSKNQFSSNVIALSNFDKAIKIGTSNFDKALIKHGIKQSESIDSIDIPETNIQKETIDSKIFNAALSWMKENSPLVLKLNQPFTENEFTRLREAFTNDQIKHLLLKMHNWKPLLKQSVSANLTFRKWAKRETFEDMIIEQKEVSKLERKPETEDITKMTSSEYLIYGMKPEYR